MIDPAEDLSRAVEATLFAASEPMTVSEIAAYVGIDADVKGARDAGWDQAYFSPTGNVDTMATYSVRNLGELRPILL